jgi:hypothetical protein
VAAGQSWHQEVLPAEAATVMQQGVLSFSFNPKYGQLNWL